VEVRGSWNGWQSSLVLSQDAGRPWAGSLSLSECQLPVQYKFIVDGNWCCDDQQPTVQDSSGNRNNIKHGSKPAASGVTGGDPQPIAGPDLRQGGPLGILAAKQVLNLLHAKLGREGFTEIASRQLAEDVVAVQRRAPDSGRATWFVVRSAYSRDGAQHHLPCDLDVLTVPGDIGQLHAAATLSVDRGQGPEANDKTLTGLHGRLCVHGSIQDVAHVWREGSDTKVKLHTFPAGSVLVFSTAPGLQAECRARLDRLLAAEAVERPLKELSLAELNYLLFSCEAEELDRSDGQRGAYNVNDHGPLVYCGLMGVCAALTSTAAP
jgi:glycogen debranching enzyme